MGSNGKSDPSVKGRGSSGRFVKGSAGGPGNPHSKAVNTFRSAILEATTREDMLEIWAVLIENAKSGDLRSIREVFDRIIGKPKESVEIVGDMRETVVLVSDGIKKLSERFDHRTISLS